MSIVQSTNLLCLAETSQASFGKWQQLPAEVVDLMLDFMLVSTEPITNPWTQKMRTLKTDYGNIDESEDFNHSNGMITTTFNPYPTITHSPSYRHVTIEYSWSRYMRPALLATCKEYHRRGINLLYGLNTFKFTHLMGQLGQEDWSIFVGPKTSPKSDASLNSSVLNTNLFYRCTQG